MKYYIYFTVLLGLFSAFSCNRENPPSTDKSSSWEKYENSALEFSKSNTDSMLYYVSRLQDEAMKAGDQKWNAKAILLVGFYNSLKGNPDTAIFLYRKARDIAESIPDSSVIKQTHYYFGSHYFGIGLFQNAEKEYLSGLAYAEKINDTAEIVRFYSRLGSVAENSNNLSKAQEYMHKAMTISEKIHDTITIAASMRNLAYVVRKSGDTLMSLQYLRSSLALFREKNDIRWMAKVYSDLGIYYRYKEPDSAYYYYNKALDIYKTMGDEGTTMITNFNMANLLFDKGKYREAEKAFLKIYNKTLKENNLIGQAYSTIMLAQTYERLNDFSNAMKFLGEAEERAEQWNQSDFTINLFETKISTSNTQGNYQESVELYKKYVNLKDSLYAKENKNKILELQNQFDNEKKEFEISNLKQQTSIQQDKLHDRTVLIIELAVILLLILLFLAVIYYYYRKSSTANQRLTEQSEELKKEIQNREKIQKTLIESEQQLIKTNAAKDKFFSIIAHDLKNPFNTILGFSDLLATEFQDFTKDEIREFLGNISNASKQAYTLLENLLIWAQTQNRNLEFKPEVIDIKSLINDAIALVEIQAKTKNIELTSRITESQMVSADKNMIDIILRNLLTNAIKFTPQSGKVEVSAVKSGGRIDISIRDNGVGIAAEQLPHVFRIESDIKTRGTERETGSGLGLILCKEFAEMQGGNISVESEEGKGSIFTFSIPLAEKP